MSAIESAFRRAERCRICGGGQLIRVLDLGATPLANAFVEPAKAAEPEPRYPLEALRCATCGLVQLSVVVSPEVLFRHYVYASGASAPMVAHFDAYADEIARRFAPADSLVVEIGSNDGTLLAALTRRHVRPLGIEPSTNLARVANESGLETWNEFFSPDVAARVVDERGPASAVLANNVLAHIDDLTAVAQAVDVLLSTDGVLVAEFPYLADLLERVEYDTIYHEHLSYLALRPLARLFSVVGLELFDVRRVPTHGGSVRLFVGRRGRRTPTVALGEALDREDRDGLATAIPYADFALKVEQSRARLRTLLAELHADGRRVAALGATAKGNTLLNFCHIGPDTVEWIADSTPLKQGLLSPGMRIPVRAEGAILAERPDATLLLAWNYADAIVDRFAEYVRAGGRFIHPIPLARFIP